MIDILLSTYNGEKYLAEQLDSLFRQSFQEFRIIVRDDCSSDGTIAILQRYQSAHPYKMEIIYGEHNIGYIKSFEYLLSISTSDYAMFCDQDDVWMPEKISVSLRRMKQCEATYGTATPILVHTDLKVADENLNIICHSFIAYSGIPVVPLEKDIHYLGFSNTATGCTSIFNRALISIALPFRNGIMHDAWMAISAKMYGQIDFVAEPTILYRQHGHNSLGAKGGRFSVKQKLSSIQEVFANACNAYRSTKGIIYRNIFQFLYYKIIYTIRYRL